MGPRSTRRRGPLHALLAALLALLLGTATLTGCGPENGAVTSLGATGGTRVEGGTATMALPPAATPNWIFPIGTAGYLASYNNAVQDLLYPPLYTADRKSVV